MTGQEIRSFETNSGIRHEPCRRDLNGSRSTPMNVLKYAPHEHVFMQGDRPKGIYKVLKGTIISYRLMADGRRQIQSFVSGGEYLAITFAERHDVSAEAITPVEVLCTPRATFDRRLETDTQFRRNVLTMMGDKLQRAREQALLLGRKNALERTASFLIFLDERFRQPETGYVEIRMSRCDMADYLGLTLETVSRMMNKLKQMGIIDLPQATRFAVCKRAQLIAMAGEIDVMEPMAA
ncbi:MAG: helix-turn-helix domain-containing protein [Hyphomonadaceae bacterium]|nr:helix-turn-helix domain-containing protein [Hyphomonadaceae bacterium]